MFKLFSNKKLVNLRLQALELKLENLQSLVDEIRDEFGKELKLLKEAHTLIKEDCIKNFDYTIEVNKILQTLLDKEDKPKKKVKRTPKRLDKYNEV